MTQPYQVDLIETGIMRIVWNGVVNRENFSQGILDRKQFADDHHLSRYVLIFDLRKAHVTVFDVRLAAWSANADPRMTHTLIIGQSGIVLVTVNAMLRLTNVHVEFVNSDQQALRRARDIVGQWEGTES